MIVKPQGVLREYLRKLEHPWLRTFRIKLDDAEVAAQTAHVKAQHPDEPHPEARAIARLMNIKHYLDHPADAQASFTRIGWSLVALLSIVVLELLPLICKAVR